MNSLTFRILCFALVISSPIIAARRYYQNRLSVDCVPQVKFEKDFSFFPETYKISGLLDRDGVRVTVADDFRVTYGENYKFVENLRVNESYVLHQCGTEDIDLAAFPADAKVFEIPLSSVGLADVTSSSFLAELDVTDRVTFANGYATDACLQKVSHLCGREASDPSSPFADEVLVRKQNRRTDAVFVSGATNSSRTIAFTATSDPAVLNRAEWVKFISLFFNKEPEGNAFFARVVRSWDKYKLEGNKGPTVAWINYQNYTGQAEFFIHQADYKTEFIAAAGGVPLSTRLLKKTKGLMPTTNGFLIAAENRRVGVQTLHRVLQDVDVVIDETYQPNNTAYGLDEFLETYGMNSDDDFAFLKNSKVFRLDGLVGNATDGNDSMDWYETAVARPDLVLKDLQQIFETRKHSRHNRRWLRSLSAGEIPQRIVHFNCEEFKSCYATPQPICPSVEVTCLGEISYRNVTSPCQQVVCD